MMIHYRSRPAHRSRNAAGFTLIELVIALVISGIVAGVVFDMILGQNRFARYQNAREEVQQNSRVALELIASELRSLPPAAIQVAQPHRIRFDLPRAWGVLCTPVTSGTTTIWVRFPAGVFPAEWPTSASTSWGVSVGHPEPNGSRTPLDPDDPPIPDDVENLPLFWSRVTSVTSPGGGNDCTSAFNNAISSQVDDRSFSGTGFFDVYQRVEENTIPRGTPVFVFQTVEYDVSDSNVPGLWIRRNTLPNAQPMAGPVPASTGTDAGLQLEYIHINGSVILNPVVPLTRLSPNDTIARVGLRVRTISTSEINGTPQVETASTEVYLRNRN